MKLQLIVCLLTSALITGLASAQSTDRDSARAAAPRYEDDRRDDGTGFALRTGLGFTADPTTFLMAIELPYSFTRSFQLGPLVQIGVDDRETLVAATLNARYFVDFGQSDSNNSFLSELAPFFQGGLGLAYLNRDVFGGDIDDTAFLLNMGFGVDFPLTEKISIGSNMMFNIVPGDVLNENFFFSWQLVTAQFRF